MSGTYLRIILVLALSQGKFVAFFCNSPIIILTFPCSPYLQWSKYHRECTHKLIICTCITQYHNMQVLVCIGLLLMHSDTQRCLPLVQSSQVQSLDCCHNDYACIYADVWMKQDRPLAGRGEGQWLILNQGYYLLCQKWFLEISAVLINAYWLEWAEREF